MECGCNCQQENARGDRGQVGRLGRDLVGSYYWSGNCCKDYFFFIANWHPLLGIFLSHPAHPWSKVERFATFFVSCSLSMLPSAMMARELRDDPMINPTYATFVAVTVPVMIWEIALYWINIGDIFCKGRGGVCDCMSRCFRCFKNCCLCFSVLFSLLVLFVSYRWASNNNINIQGVVHPFLVSRVQSWVLWFPLWTFLPCLGFLWGWCSEKSAADEGIDLINGDAMYPVQE